MSRRNIILIEFLVGFFMTACSVLLFFLYIMSTIYVAALTVMLFGGLAIMIFSLYSVITYEAVYSKDVESLNIRNLSEQELSKRIFELEGNYKEGLISEEEFKKQKNDLYDFFS